MKACYQQSGALKVGVMKVDDLVRMPGAPESITGIVLQTKPDGINRGTPHLRRVKVYWIEDAESSWEPKKWLEVISESR